MGIEILSFTIKDVYDNVTYLASLGKYPFIFDVFRCILMYFDTLGFRGDKAEMSKMRASCIWGYMNVFCLSDCVI